MITMLQNHYVKLKGSVEANPPIAPAASPPWMHCGPTVSRPTVRIPGNEHWTYQEAPKQTKMSMEKSHYWPNQPSGKTWAELYSGCEQDTVACEHIWSESASWTLHSAIAKKQNRRSTTSSRTVPSGGNRDTSYGRRVNGGRPAPHHPVHDNMWTEGLSTADRPQKKKKKETLS